LGATAAIIGPSVIGIVFSRMVSSRPRLLDNGPADKAPMRPPRVNIDWTRPNSAGVIAIHCGIEVEVWRMDLRLQVITSDGALSSASSLVSGKHKSTSEGRGAY